MAMKPVLSFLVLLLCVVSATASAQAPSRETGVPSAAEILPPITSMALAAPNFRWHKLETARADLYFPEGEYKRPVMARHAMAAERAIAANMDWLRAAPTGAKVRVFFLKSRLDMRQFVGGTPGGSAIEMEGTAFVVANDSVRPSLRHETMHLLAWRAWGPPAASWLSEGLATAAVPACRGLNADDVAAVLDRSHRLVPLDSLRQNFTTAGEEGVVHYYESASLVRYIDRVYGRKQLRALWSMGGLANVRPALGIDAATLERNWRASIARTPARTTWPALWGEIRAFGCE
jgi:hypothetical protein